MIWFYQGFIAWAIYFATDKWGAIGYLLSLSFWFIFSLANVRDTKLFVFQLITIGATAYLLRDRASESVESFYLTLKPYLIVDKIGLAVIFVIVAIILLKHLYSKLEAGVLHNASKAKTRLHSYQSDRTLAYEDAKDLSREFINTGVPGAKKVDMAVIAIKNTYLKVPYADKDEAKSLGARWDRSQQKWYAPKGEALEPFKRWL